MKKFLSMLLVGVMCISLCACGGNDTETTDTTDTESTSVNSTKGTKNDPYTLGEEISFHTCSMDGENEFDVTMTFSELSTEEVEKAMSLRPGGEDDFLGVKFKIASKDGGYSNTISNRTDSDGGFYINALTEDMTEAYCDFFPHDSKSYVYDMYADTDYDLFMTYNQSNDYKYLTITYRTGEYDTATVWVDLTL